MTRIIHNKYEVIKLLGTGATGSVTMAKDLHLERFVAIKEMEKANDDKKEMQLLTQLKHMGLPEIYDYFEEDGHCFIVMEFINGITLKQFLEKNGKAKVQVCVNWMKQLAELLEYLHGQHPAIIYRDLKPANIMITLEGQIKLIDLGGAFQRVHNAKEEKVCVGTPAYSAPEQWKGVHVDPTCDVYSYGAIFHELLTGVSPVRPPYERRPIRQYDRSLPVGLEELILRCLQEDPGQRYATMGDLLKELAQYKYAGRKRHMVFEAKRLLLGSCLAVGLFQSITPFLRGISTLDFPFPYLMTPIKWITLCSMGYLLLFRLGRSKRSMIRQEKDIWLTEKRGLGLLLFMVFVMGNICAALILESTQTTSMAGAGKKNLWVNVKDEQNRNVLVRDGTVFPVKEKLKFELNVEEIPEEAVSVRIVAIGSEGEIYESRAIRVTAADD